MFPRFTKDNGAYQDLAHAVPLGESGLANLPRKIGLPNSKDSHIGEFSPIMSFAVAMSSLQNGIMDIAPGTSPKQVLRSDTEWSVTGMADKNARRNGAIGKFISDPMRPCRSGFGRVASKDSITIAALGSSPQPTGIGFHNKGPEAVRFRDSLRAFPAGRRTETLCPIMGAVPPLADFTGILIGNHTHSVSWVLG